MELGLGLAQAQAQQCPGSGLAAGFLFAMAKGRKETEIGREKEQRGQCGSPQQSNLLGSIRFGSWTRQQLRAVGTRSWPTHLPPLAVACRVQDGLLPVYLPSAFN